MSKGLNERELEMARAFEKALWEEPSVSGVVMRSRIAVQFGISESMLDEIYVNFIAQTPDAPHPPSYRNIKTGQAIIRRKKKESSRKKAARESWERYEADPEGTLKDVADKIDKYFKK